MEPVEPVEVVHGRIPVGERPGYPGTPDERLGVEQSVQVPRTFRRPRSAHRDMVLEIRIVRSVPIIEEIAECAQVQSDVRIVTHVGKRGEHPSRLRLILRFCRDGGHHGSQDGYHTLFHLVSFIPDKDNHFPPKTHKGPGLLAHSL